VGVDMTWGNSSPGEFGLTFSQSGLLVSHAQFRAGKTARDTYEFVSLRFNTMKVRVMQVLKTYQELRRYCGHFSKGAWPCFLIIGNAGVGKSRTMAEALPSIRDPEDEGARWIGSHVTAFQLYKELHNHQDRTFVLDDVDNLCRNPAIVTLLKCVCNSENSRRVFWATSNKDLEKEGIPREFDTTSRVALIINEWETVNRNVGALEDRGMVVRFAPSSAEVHGQVTTWFKDKRVLDYVEARLDRIFEPSQRLYLGASSLRKCGEDWKEWVEQEIALPDELQIVRELRADTSYTSEYHRLLRYTTLTGKGRASYFRVVSDLKSLEQTNSVVATKAKLPPRKRGSLPVTQAVELTLRKAAKVGSKAAEGGKSIGDNEPGRSKRGTTKQSDGGARSQPGAEAEADVIAIPVPIIQSEDVLTFEEPGTIAPTHSSKAS
jgi:hypothetical protein